MLATLTIVVPVFVVILLGYGVGKTRLFSEEGVKALTAFCFYVAIPALLFRAMAGLETPAGFDFRIVLAFYGATMVSYALAMLVSRLLFGLKLADQAIFAAGATYSNILLLGLPLVLTAYGQAAAVPQSAILGFQSVILISLTSLVVELGRGRNGEAGIGVGKILKTAAIGLATNPVIVALVAGLAWGQTGLGLHAIVDRSLHFLGQAATPTALFALGASLTRFTLGGDMRQVGALGAIKLFVQPGLVYVSCRYVFALPPLSVAVATISAAMPTGVTGSPTETPLPPRTVLSWAMALAPAYSLICLWV